MNEIIKLPVVLNTHVIVECWTHYKLAIIQASPFADEWLASHLEVMTNENLHTTFGTISGPYDMEYYSNIVVSKEIPLWETSPEKILDTIIDCITNNEYVQLFISNKECIGFDNFKYHEIFIYGFNKRTECFYASTVNKGRFVETCVPFIEIKERYTMFYEFSKTNIEIVTYQRNYQYPITKLSLNYNYEDKNAIFNFLRKIDRECIGKELNVHEYDENRNIQFDYNLYTGLGCLSIFSNVLEKGCQAGYLEESILHKSRDTTCKLINHRDIILRSMYWSQRTLGGDEKTNRVIEQYKNARNNFEIIESLLSKYTIWKYRQPELLNRIFKRVEQQYADEKRILTEYYLCLLNIFSNSLRFEKQGERDGRI